MDLDRMREIVASIPTGSWMSYGDVAAAAGGSDVHARTLNQRFIRRSAAGGGLGTQYGGFSHTCKSDRHLL